MSGQNVARGSFALKNNFKGTATHGYKKLENDSLVMHGAFNFTSDVYEIDTTNLIMQVMIKGNYTDGLKSGVWNYEQNEYKVRIAKLNNLQVDARLDGVQKSLQASYMSGLPHGKWTYNMNKIKQSKRIGVGAKLDAQFKQGYAIGDFTFNRTYNGSSIFVSGKFDDKGRMHGKWVLKYQDSMGRVTEERNYQEGFLLDLAVKCEETDSVVIDLSYEDVKLKLQQIEHITELSEFKKGDSLFAILFNDGYRLTDPKITAQFAGNLVLVNAFQHIADTSSTIFGVPGFSFPKIGFTRRFQYVYPEYEKMVLREVDSLVNAGLNRCDSLINSPALKINKQKNDTLVFLYAFLELAQKKFFIIHDEISNLKSPQFDYENRANYYANGIAGLEALDTVKFEVVGKRHAKPLEFGFNFSEVDSVVYNLLFASQRMHRLINEYLDPVVEMLAAYQSEQIIDSLDKAILVLEDSLKFKYLGTPKLMVDEVSGRIITSKPITSVQYEVFVAVGKKQIELLLREYANLNELEAKVAKGNQICELILGLIAAYPKLDNIATMPATFDEAFTRRSPNPFFEREIITRIKPAIYAKGAERLYEYLIENIGKSTTREELDTNIELLFRLEKKLLNLAASDQVEVNRLNTRLRRENQPERIRRLFGM